MTNQPTTKMVPYVDWTMLYKRGVPVQYHEPLKAYVFGHTDPGRFLSAILCNDLALALEFFDGNGGLSVLRQIVSFVRGELPADIVDAENYRAWCQP